MGEGGERKEKGDDVTSADHGHSISKLHNIDLDDAVYGRCGEAKNEVGSGNEGTRRSREFSAQQTS